MRKKKFLSIFNSARGVGLFILIACILAFTISVYAQKTQKPFMTVVIPGINDTADTGSVGNAMVFGTTPKRYRVAEPPPRRQIISRNGSYFIDEIDEKEPTDPIFGADQSLYIDPNNPDDIKKLEKIAAEPNVQVFVDMNLGIELGGSWKKPTEWAKKVTTILAGEHKKKFPGGDRRMIAHSAGCEAALKVQQEEERSGRELFNQKTIAMSARSPLKHPPTKTLHIMSQGDFIASPGGMPSISATATAKELHKKGATVIQFVDENRSQSNKWSALMNPPFLTASVSKAVSGKIQRAFEAHSEMKSWYQPNQKMKVFIPGEEKAAEFRTSLSVLLPEVDNVTPPVSRSSSKKVNADISAGKIEKIRERIQKTQPSQGLGGISLNTVARVPLDPKSIETATFSVTSKCILMRLRDGKNIRLPRMEPEVARLCFDVTYQRGKKPELSIGGSQFELPTGKKVLNLHPFGRKAVYYLGGTQHTMLGLTMYLADVALGKLAFYGSSADIREVTEKVPGFHSLPELYPQKYTKQPKANQFLGADTRISLHPSVVQLDWTRSGNSLEFTNTSWAIRYGVSGGPAEDAFITFFSRHFDKISETAMGEPLKKLVPYAQASALFRWLKLNDVSFDGNSLSTIRISSAVTPKYTKADRSPGLREIKPKRPAILFGPHGPMWIFPKGGGKTIISYKKGRVNEVKRHDGALLEIIRDDLGTPIAVRKKPMLEAAFLIDKERGPIFADNVELIFNRNMLKVKMTRKTIIFPDNQWESTVGLIIARFISKE